MNARFYSLDLSCGTIYLTTFTLFRLRTRLKGSLRPACSMQFDDSLSFSFNFIFGVTFFTSPVDIFL